MSRARVYAALNEGLSLWHGGDPHPAHEAWEEAWKILSGAEKTLAQALIQLAAARVKHRAACAEGVRKLLAKVEDNLSSLTDREGEEAALGLDVKGLLSAVRALPPRYGDEALAALLPARLDAVGILYLHGFGSGPGSTKARIIAGALQEDGFAVRVPDLNEGDFENLTVSRALASARRALFDRTLVIGSSMGGYLATLLAERSPRVSALVLMAPAFDLAERLERRYDAEGRWKKDGRVLVEHVAYGGEHPIAYGFIEDAQRYPGRPQIPTPAYVITGERDEVVPVDLVRRVVEASGEGVVLEVVDDDHSLIASAHRPLEEARRLAETLLDDGKAR